MSRSLCDFLLTVHREQAVCTTLAEWMPIWQSRQIEDRSPFVRAIDAAMSADRMAWAFFCGYQGALQSAFSERIRPGQVAALGVNESGRKITQISTALETKPDGMFLQGAKSWILGGPDVETLFVLARLASGPVQGPGSMVMVQLPIDAQGVKRGALQPQTVVSDLPHSSVDFNAVAIDPTSMLAGDGYADYAKPFRMREDIYVTGCTLAYLLSEGRSAGWNTKWAQRCIAAIVGLGGCSQEDPRNDTAQILTAGALSFAGDVLRESEQLWTASQNLARERWQRDQPLLQAGKEARKLRALKAWNLVTEKSFGSKERS